MSVRMDRTIEFKVEPNGSMNTAQHSDEFFLDHEHTLNWSWHPNDGSNQQGLPLDKFQRCIVVASFDIYPPMVEQNILSFL